MSTTSWNGTSAPHTEQPIVGPGHTFATVTDKIASLVLQKKTPLWWFFGLAVAFGLLQLLLMSVALLLVRGVGIWGVNVPVGWAFAIINFVWWIGIGHAGTLISAILRKAGAHYVIDSLADIEPVIDDINARLARGERP